MPERRTDDNRTSRFQHIERGSAGLHAGGAHAFLEPAHYLEPGVRVGRLRVVKAGLDPLLQFRDGQRFVVEAALQELPPCLERMHVPVDQARHQEFSLQVHRHGCRTGEWRYSLIAADVNDFPVANGERLGSFIFGIRRENHAVAVYAVGGRRRRRGHQS